MGHLTCFRGCFYTLQPGRRTAGRVWVDDSGTIVSLDSDPGASDAVTYVDMPLSSVITPGLYDGHTHMLFVLTENSVDLSECKAMATVAERLAYVSQQLQWQAEQADGWVLATNWSNDAQTGIPDVALRQVINEAVGNRNVMIMNESWHAAVLSSNLETSVISAFTGNGLNGHCEDGVVTEDWVIQTLGLIELDSDELQARILRRQSELLGRGITSIFDKLILGHSLLDAMHVISASGQLILPTQAAVQPIMAFGPRPVMPGDYGPSLRVTHLKYLADGALGAMNADLEPFGYLNGTMGESTLPPFDQFKRDMRHWQEIGGTGMAAHCIGPGATAKVLTAYGDLMDLVGSEGFNFCLDHFEIATPLVIRAAARLQSTGADLSVCSQPAFTEDLGKTDRLSPELLRCLNPYATFAREGLQWFGGTDGPITGDDYLGGMAQAVNRNDSEAISAEAVFRACVEAPLEVGKPFTAICLDRDPFECPEQMGDVKILQTWIKGQLVHARGK